MVYIVVLADSHAVNASNDSDTVARMAPMLNALRLASKPSEVSQIITACKAIISEK